MISSKIVSDTELPKTVEEVFAHAGGARINLTKDEEDRLWAEGFDTQQHMLVFRPEEKGVGYCSKCRQLINLLPNSPEQKHKGKMTCPCCMETREVLHMWRYKSVVRQDKAIRYVYRKSVLDQSCVVAWCLYVIRTWDKWTLPERTELEWLVDSISVFVPGKGGRMIKPVSGNKITSNIWQYGQATYSLSSTGPKPRHGVYDNMSYAYYSISKLDVSWDSEAILAAVKDSPLSYGLREYMEHAEGPYLRYMDRCQRLPAVEMLVKIGLGQLVAENLRDDWGGACVWGNYSKGKINWRGKTLDRILRRRLSKEEKHWLQEQNRQIGTEIVGAWQSLPSQPSLQLVKSCQYNLSIYVSIENDYGIPLERAHRYMEEQEGYPSDYQDYLSECRALEYEWRKNILFPKDLQEAHRKTASMVKLQASKMLNKTYQKRRKILMPIFTFEDDIYQVIVPRKIQALVKEGEEQHNCVGGYMERVAKGDTNVVFVRAKDKPRKSLGTVEVSNTGMVIQARAAFNKALPEDVMSFVNRFATEIQRRLGKKRIGA